jgi:hypothetical protein
MGLVRCRMSSDSALLSSSSPPSVDHPTCTSSLSSSTCPPTFSFVASCPLQPRLPILSSPRHIAGPSRPCHTNRPHPPASLIAQLVIRLSETLCFRFWIVTMQKVTKQSFPVNNAALNGINKLRAESPVIFYFASDVETICSRIRWGVISTPTTKLELSILLRLEMIIGSAPVPPKVHIFAWRLSQEGTTEGNGN